MRQPDHLPAKAANFADCVKILSGELFFFAEKQQTFRKAADFPVTEKTARQAVFYAKTGPDLSRPFLSTYFRIDMPSSSSDAGSTFL